MAAKKTPIVKQPDPPAEPVAAEIIATEILAIAKGIRALNASRLKRDAVVTLIARTSGVSRGTIEIVLNNLDALEEIWLKKAP